MKISAGDVVTLKSSKVPMVVKKAGDDDAVCVWHDVEGMPHEHAYPHIVLAVTPESVAAAKAKQDEAVKADKARAVAVQNAPHPGMVTK